MDINLKFKRGLQPARNCLIFLLIQKHGRGITADPMPIHNGTQSTPAICYIHVIINEVNRKVITGNIVGWIVFEVKIIRGQDVGGMLAPATDLEGKFINRHYFTIKVILCQLGYAGKGNPGN